MTTDGFDARYLSIEAKKCCKALHFTPRRFEPIGRTSDEPEYPVLRIWNSRKEVILTNYDLAYAGMYL